MNPLYNVTVFVPNSTLPTFTKGASCQSCDKLYPSIVFASAVTDATGHFVLKDVPAGSFPLVVQTGKWRMTYTMTNITACVDNPQPDGSLHLPKNSMQGDLPDIGISTGNADSLECLLRRIGVDATEYVGGAAPSGHVHIFQGYNGATTVSAAPSSPAALWDKPDDLAANDVLLMSCEGRDTAGISPAYQQFMVDYAAAGGRVFASHYQYAWFATGPFAQDNLATWTTGATSFNDTVAVPTNVVTTLPSGAPFPEGMALHTWLGTVNALTNNRLLVYYARHNADVGPANTPSQAWLTVDPSSTFAPNSTQYFTFDTPVGGDGGAGKCGRVAYSDLHVSGGMGANEPPSVLPDYPAKGAVTVPEGCAIRPLTPQEKSLEFMLFDLSSCLLTVGATPSPPK